MNYEELESQLLAHWRGRRSQAALSRRLGYKSNVVFDWESGRRSPSAAKAFRLARLTGVDHRAAVLRFTRRNIPWLKARSFESDEGVARFMRDLQGKAKLLSLASELGCSRYTLGRWLKGQSAPSLAEFLHFVEVTSLRLLDFVSELADPLLLASTREDWKRLVMARELAYELPWSHAVLRVLELAEYQSLKSHRPGFVASRLGISLNEERECLKRLAQSGQIRKGRRWELVESQTIDTRRDPVRSRELRAFWSDLGAARIRAGADGDFCYNLFGVSRKDLEKLRTLQRDYFSEFRRIVASSEPVEEVVLTNLHLFTLDECSSR